MKISVAAAGFLAASFVMAQPSHAQDASAGERLFRQRCASCHTVQPGQNRIGPHLAGIVGRKPGSVEGARYSKGLSALEPNWDAANLDAYLDWAAKDQAANLFEKGNRTQNYVTVTTCVQSAAEFGTGTMAKISPAERLGKIQQLRQIMDSTGS